MEQTRAGTRIRRCCRAVEYERGKGQDSVCAFGKMLMLMLG